MSGVSDVGGEWVEAAEVGDEGRDFGLPDARGGVADLSVQIRTLHGVAVNDADGADAGAGNVLRGGAAEAAGANDEDFGVYETELGWR